MARRTSESSSIQSKIGFAITSYVHFTEDCFHSAMKNHLDACLGIWSLFEHLGAQRPPNLLRPTDLMRFRQRVLEFIGVLAFVDLDSEITGEACKLSRPGIRHYGNC